MAALTPAVICGMLAAVTVPWIADQTAQPVLNGWLSGLLVHIPVGNGYELHWSWLVFCLVTLAAWALFAVARDR